MSYEEYREQLENVGPALRERILAEADKALGPFETARLARNTQPDGA